MQDIILNSFINSTELHLLVAFVLGLMLAVNPCQIAICVSAIFTSFNARENKLKNKIVYFAFGRALTYVFLAILILYLFYYTGIAVEDFYDKKISDFVDKVIPYLSFAFGAFFFYRAINKHHHDDSCHNSRNIIKKNKPFGMFVLGAVLALVFCPESALTYFAMLMPLAIKSNLGILNVIVFAIAAVLPLIIIAAICGNSITKANDIERKLEKLQVVINYISSFLLFVLGFIFLFF